MLVRLIALLNRTLHSIALLHVTYLCNKPRWGVTAGKFPIGLFGHCADRRRVSLVDFYRRSQHPTLITAVPYEKVVDRTGTSAINVLGRAIACLFRRTLALRSPYDIRRLSSVCRLSTTLIGARYSEC